MTFQKTNQNGENKEDIKKSAREGGDRSYKKENQGKWYSKQEVERRHLLTEVRINIAKLIGVTNI